MNERLSRSERHKRSRKGKSAIAEGGALPSRAMPAELTGGVAPGRITRTGGEESAEVEVSKLPTRKELYPSQRVKWTKWFFNTLLYVFVAILLVLLWWGLSDSPWGEKYGLSGGVAFPLGFS
ncbi:hypothetical protein J25TS5_05120 [Paenibacillus faecis]|uniref:hypothetical protein n=1 Tax=Paenibacillus faecis TaxID=862114 RepID=UPI000F903311|nr:hypothetical protein [Paenibacillus faecis]GIO83580.1 hypothetical protein J25TS5_05120 [Paenibacillus faecis]